MPDIINILSADDRRVAAYFSIRERDLTRGLEARFLVEGKVTLETLLTRSNFRPESLFLSKSRLNPLQELIDHVPEGVPVYLAAQEVMDQVAGFPVHRGVLACGWKGKPRTASSLLCGLVQGHETEATFSAAPYSLPDVQQTVLCLIELSNHDNVGACFRNAEAFGADAVLLDHSCCDPLYRKAIRVSSGTVLTLPFSHNGSANSIFTALVAAGFEIWCLTPHSNATPITNMQRPPKLALVLGAEGPGLPEYLLTLGHSVRIPMTKGFDSINVATAAAIALSAIFTPAPPNL